MSVLLYSGETWAVVKQHISPLAVPVQHPVCGVSAARQKTQVARSRFQDA